MIIHKCDRKGCETTHEQVRGTSAITPPDWYPLTWGRYSSDRIFYEICPGCQKALKLPEPVTEKDVGQKLLEIIEDLVTDAVEANRE